MAHGIQNAVHRLLEGFRRLLPLPGIAPEMNPSPLLVVVLLEYPSIFHAHAPFGDRRDRLEVSPASC
jgi:hypothetical protein